MTRLAPSLALLAAVGLLAACGKFASSGSIAKHPSGSSSNDRARALAFARAVNLTAADVPGFSAFKRPKEHESPSEKRLQAKLDACVHPVSATPVGEASSPDFERRAGIARASVRSQVRVAASAATAARELVLVRSRRTRECVSGYIERLAQAQPHPGASVGAVTVVQRTPPAPGADGSFAWRIAVPITAHGVTIGVYLDIFGFVSGPNGVTLVMSGDPAPPPARAEGALFSLLLARAQAAEHEHGVAPARPNPNVTSS